MPRLRPKTRHLSRDRSSTIYETWSPVSSIVFYNRERGRAPRSSARRHRPFCVSGRAAPDRGAAMTDLLHFIARSLLPSWSWLPIAERLRAGDPPAAVFDRLLATHWPGEPDQRSTVYARARAAIDRAHAQRITPLAW